MSGHDRGRLESGCVTVQMAKSHSRACSDDVLGHDTRVSRRD